MFFNENRQSVVVLSLDRNELNYHYVVNYLIEGDNIVEKDFIKSNVCIYHDGSFKKYEDEKLILLLYKKYNGSIHSPVFPSDLLD